MSRMADRQLAILRILSSGKIITVSEIARRTESSVSTIKRDLADLSVNYPIQSYAGHGGGYIMEKSSNIGNQYFTIAELKYIRTTMYKIADDSETRYAIIQKLSVLKPHDDE